MKGNRLKQIKIFFIVALVVILLEQIPPIQQQTAIFASKIYVLVNYGSTFTYQNIEYSPQFGNYDVFYTDQHREQHSFTVIPKYFPIFVSYDSISKQALAFPEYNS
ncbi:hypothetical protein [Paenibacillus sp. DCT19]|uniref:hypothetical protein n=1 Tax=Paenibacillus sp. DCT19 TaxID=2211212 RepID=UPI000FE20D8D|nr:hypothetical protein [Paenibacillus sp. DCT19]